MSKTSKRGEAGMVSIIVTLIMMIVISLITLGFGEVARRNQSEATDRQLSSQAFYAAETGVNDVLHAIADGTYNYASGGDFTDCHAGSGTNFIERYSLTAKASLADGGAIGYSCLMVTKDLNDYVTDISAGTTKVVPINLSASTPLTFQWQTNDPAKAKTAATCSTNAAGSNTLFEPSSTASTTPWVTHCPYGVLRVDLFDTSGGYGNADTMAAHTATLFMVPRTSGTPATVQYGQSTIVGATCDAQQCSARVNLNSPSLQYYAQIRGLYEDLNTVTITGQPPTTFSGAQLLIDSTGKAQDVLRRIAVRVPLTSDQGVPLAANALQSGGGICKRFITLGSGHRANDAANDTTIPTSICSAP